MIDKFIQTPLKELQEEAFKLRKTHFGNELTFSFPSIVASQQCDFPNNRFSAISVTGKHCDLQCAHCKGMLLESMIPAESPEAFFQIAERLRTHGALGMLVSGGADRDGHVPLKKFISSIAAMKQKYPRFRIIVHTGLIQREMARELRKAGVDQILVEVIGDDDTIRKVYHLNKRVEDYEETLWMLKEEGHHLAPHIIIGHHFGKIKGEWRALEIITRVGVETIVLVVIKPFPQTEMEQIQIPRPEETSKVSAIARILNPAIPIRVGCIRPAHPWKAEMERDFILSGVNTITYPLQGTIDYAKEIGLETKFTEMCCSLG